MSWNVSWMSEMLQAETVLDLQPLRAMRLYVRLCWMIGWRIGWARRSDDWLSVFEFAPVEKSWERWWCVSMESWTLLANGWEQRTAMQGVPETDFGLIETVDWKLPERDRTSVKRRVHFAWEPLTWWVLTFWASCLPTGDCASGTPEIGQWRQCGSWLRS